MGVDKIPLLSEKCIELAESDNWNRSPSFGSTGLSVAWKDLTVASKIGKSGFFKKGKTKYKDIIRNVSGAVQPASLVAILGASGSGKSTLMSILANRNPGELRVKGKITVGGTPIGKFTKYVSGFVYQDDLFIATLTVMEHLNFTARLRLDRYTSESDRRALIDEILTELGLMKIANSRIGFSKFGNEKMNLSGGERKRLSIATELITDPSLLFCDEPTTGLDAFTALKVISSLRDLVNSRHKTIICSIHQPSSRIFELFDQIILLAGGKMAFSGAVPDALTFFKSQGYSNSDGKSEADFFIQSLAHESVASYADDFCSAYERSEYYKTSMEFVDKEINKNIPPGQILSAYHKHLSEPSWINKLTCITERSFINSFRDGSVQKFRIIQKLTIGILIGLCMTGTVEATQVGMQSLKGAVFFIIGQNFFPAIQITLHEMPKQLPIFSREYSNNTNTPSLFYLSQIISTLPGFIFDPLSFTLIMYFMIGLDPSIYAILITCILSVLVFNTSATFGLFMSLNLPKLELTEAVTTPILNILIFCSGVYVKLSSIPFFLGWIRVVSWLANGIECLFIVQLANVNEIACERQPCLTTKEDVLASYDFHAENFWSDFIKIFGLYFVFHVGAYVGLMRKVRAKRMKMLKS